ncbi:MAG: DUF1361 domain-containing protein [Cyanobacteria bacterium P01_C01_bin.69]
MTPIDIAEWLAGAVNTAGYSMYFMLWNTFLALIPFGLSLWLFRKRGAGHNRIGWWVGFAVFMAFLPNAPYVLTDIIHLVRFIREGVELWTVVLVLIPQYLIFMLIGIEAYVASLVNLGSYLRKRGYGRWILTSELVIHALCAIGIYLGRFPRFNSWDLVTAPHQVALYLVKALLTPRSLLIILVTFAVITVVYWPLKQVTLALLLYSRSLKRSSIRKLNF